MSESRYTFPPGVPITFDVAADVVGGDLVEITGARAFSPADASTAAAWIGTASTDAVTGTKVAVFIGGVQPILAVGEIVAGELVVAAANSGVAARDAVTPEDATEVVGLALTGGTDVLVDILMAR
jgi:hypothetical protein